MRRPLALQPSLAVFAAIAFCLATIFAYQPAWHGRFIWDDDRYVTDNHLLTARDGLRRIWFSLDAPSQYFPLTYTVLRIEHLFFDLDPTGYHWVSLLLHVANALLVWGVLSRLKIPGPWFAAAVFALHPVQVESVAWISELKNVLMGFFFLLTLWMWIEYINPATRRSWLFYASAVVFYFLALSAKATACTLPAALLLILWLKQKPLARRGWIEVAPFVLLALGFGLLTVWWEKYHQGTRVLVSLSLLERFLIAGRAIWFYLGKLIWPADLTFSYPKWNIDPASPITYLGVVAAALAVAAIFYARSRFGRGIEVAALFFVATLAPVLGFVMLYTFRYTYVADHYQYLACIGPIALVSAASARAVTMMRQFRTIALSTGLAILACLFVLTWRQSATYRDLETLWRTTIEKNPSCWMAYNNLGVIELQRGKIDDAIAEYHQSLRLDPDYPEAHYNLGSALLEKRDIDNAISECQRAIELQPTDPDAHVILGNAFVAKGELDRAIDEYRHALALRPEDSKAHYNLGIALQQKGDIDAAAQEFEKAGESEPHENP
jgi:tetratricopeptide (TPR) repeat protein